MKRLAMALICMVLLCFCGGCTLEAVNENPVPFRAILVSPERYEGKTVETVGVLQKTENGYELYANRVSAEYPYPPNGIWLGELETMESHELQTANGGYVRVTGLLTMEGSTGYSCEIQPQSIEVMERGNQ